MPNYIAISPANIRQFFLFSKFRSKKQTKERKGKAMERITREILKSMRMGETRTFVLPDVAAIESGRSVAYQAQRTLGCNFALVTNFDNMTVTVTKSEAV